MRIEEVVHDAKDAQREERAQVVQVPAHLQGRRCSDNRITRTALVKGSCTVRSSYLPLAPKPAEFGIMTYNGRRSAVRNPIAEARGLLLGKAKMHTC